MNPATQFPHTNAPDKQDTGSREQVLPNDLFQLSSPIRTQPRTNTTNIPRGPQKRTSQVHPATQFPHTNAPDKQDAGSLEQVLPNDLFQLSSPIRTQPRTNTTNAPRRPQKRTWQVHPATQFPHTNAPDKQDTKSCRKIYTNDLFQLSPKYERSHAPTPQTHQKDTQQGLHKCTLQFSSHIRTQPTSKTQNKANQLLPTISSNSVPCLLGSNAELVQT